MLTILPLLVLLVLDLYRDPLGSCVLPRNPGANPAGVIGKRHDCPQHLSTDQVAVAKAAQLNGKHNSEQEGFSGAPSLEMADLEHRLECCPIIMQRPVSTEKEFFQ